jgi:glucose-6-phosphate isomerase
MSSITKTDEWKALQKHYKKISKEHLREMFENDPHRFENLSLEFEDFLLDYSKNIINNETMILLLNLARKANIHEWIANMFAGEKINSTEGRAVLHTALRNRSDNPVTVDGIDVMPDIHKVLDQMKDFVDSVHNGQWKGCTGLTIKDIVNIGIGGSDLGPKMAAKALTPYAKYGVNVHYVSNVDGTHIAETLKNIDPTTTLFIIASKTFTTQETLTNAMTARDWFLKETGNDKSNIAKHFVALSTNEEAVREFGIDPKNMFVFWDWVGGRYSMWSAIGLSLALYIGMENFIELLTGAFIMDQHFRNSKLEENAPVIMAMLGVWYADFFGAASYAVIPYDEYLDDFPTYLQQLDMESNGKRITRDGEPVDYKTGPIIWGRPGTNSQHSFFQLIHQGTQMIPADFIAPIDSHNDIGDHHKILLSNFFAQTQALMQGKTESEVKAELKNSGKYKEEIKAILPHKVFPGNKPTNTILFQKLTPKTLGMLVALYEHKVFVQGVIWNVNSFDQWGVELGKQLAKKILPQLKENEETRSLDASTNGLINHFKMKRTDI